MVSFSAEIGRRKVFQVAAAYAVVAWLLVQVITAVEEPLRLPDWFATGVIVLLGIGFPIAVIIAWAYDSAPVEAPVAGRAARRVARAGGSHLNYFLLGLIVPTLAFLVVDRFVLSGRPASEASASVTATADGGAARSSRAAPVRRSHNLLGESELISNTGLNVHVALSRDGTRLAYVKQLDGESRLYVRALDQLDGRLLAGTDGAQHPFFSPDGEWIAYFADDTDSELKRVPFRGGPAQTITAIRGSGGGFWRDDDTIVFGTQDPVGVRSLHRVPATGGTAELLLAQEPEIEGHLWPAALPGEEAILFAIRPGPAGSGPARDGRIAVLSLDSGEYRVLIDGAYAPRYSASGHILFARSGALWAVPFDASRLELTGPEVPVVENVQQNGQIGGAAYSVSRDGLLVYLSGDDVRGAENFVKQLLWVDRQGNEQPLDFEPREFWEPQISSDGRFAVSIGQGDARDIFIGELAGDRPLTRLTFDGADNRHPVWTPDDERIAFDSAGNGSPGLFIKATDGTGQAVRLPVDPGAYGMNAISPAGQFLFVSPWSASGKLYMQSPESGSAPTRLVSEDFGGWYEGHAAIAPNGRWVAYSSNVSGAAEVYARPFPNTGDGIWQISDSGGVEPRWGPDSNEIFYRDGDAVVLARVTGETALSVGTREVLFTGNYWYQGNSVPNWDVAPDGEHFLMMRSRADTETVSEQALLVTVENWFTELEARAPRSR